MASSSRASGTAIQQGLGEGGLIEQVQYRRHHRHHHRHHYRRWSPARVCHYEWRRRWSHGHWRSYRVRVCRFG
jgi:hypothetical protein